MPVMNGPIGGPSSGSGSDSSSGSGGSSRRGMLMSQHDHCHPNI